MWTLRALPALLSAAFLRSHLGLGTLANDFPHLAPQQNSYPQWVGKAPGLNPQYCLKKKYFM